MTFETFQPFGLGPDFERSEISLIFSPTWNTIWFALKSCLTFWDGTGIVKPGLSRIIAISE